jgi:hypothetical protein
MLMLLPERRLGVFVATNSSGGNAFVGGSFFVFRDDFVKHFFPRAPQSAAPAADSAALARFAGSYRLTYSRSESTPEKLAAMVMAIQVGTDRDGLCVSLPGGVKHFVQVAPLVFRQTDSGDGLVFREDAKGALREAFYDAVPLTALIKNRWHETPAFNLLLLLSSVLVFASVVISVPIFELLRLRRQSARRTPLERVTIWVALVLSVSAVATVFAALASVFDMVGLYTGKLLLWPMVFTGSTLVTGLSVGMVVCAALAWKRSALSVAGRVQVTLVCVAGWAMVWFFASWNLLAARF